MMLGWDPVLPHLYVQLSTPAVALYHSEADSGGGAAGTRSISGSWIQHSELLDPDPAHYFDEFSKHFYLTKKI